MHSSEILEKIITPEFDYNLLISKLSHYKFPRNKINSMIKSGHIIRVKKGVYVKAAEPFDKFVLSSMIYGPSYVSEDSALSFYGLIPEAVKTTTCITSGRSKHFSTEVGEFSYRAINSKFYSAGILRKTVDDNRAFLIATPEKALFDRLFKIKDIDSLDAMDDYLYNNMRLDESGCSPLNVNELRKIGKIGHVKFLDALVQSIQRRRKNV